MAENKKYKIITTIEDDAPFSNINWYTISFLTPQKLDSLKYLDVKGFKVHNGYNNEELANSDAKLIKEKYPNHDVYLSQIGKIYAWDDATKTDDIEYDNQKLNNLEKTRRENIDKFKLMREQLKNELPLRPNVNKERMDSQKKRMQQKLYDKGLITKQEYEMICQENKPVKDVKEMVNAMAKINSELDECFKTDYLDENQPTGLKYGCVTFYSPKHIGGLQTLCVKVRGLFQTVSELNQRVRRLIKLYPNDRIYTFEVGKWCTYSENYSVPGETLLKQLNYAMKCHLENMQHEKEEFEKRTENLTSQAKQEAKIQKSKNRREKRRAKRQASKQQESETIAKTTADVIVPPKEKIIPETLAPEDDSKIKQILDFLEDPDIKNKFSFDKSSLETTEINVN